jgi:glycosyltransferase involved in cell wall biosynthesis
MLPRLSIVTPSLNQGAHLEAAICSVLEQGYPELEYLIVDGGSTDNSLEVIRKYEPHLARWVSEPDRGQSHAINKGLGWATGSVVAYLNCDERYAPGALRYVGELFAGNTDSGRPEWLSGAVEYVDGQVQHLKDWQPWPPPADRARWVVRPWGVPSLGTFWRRELFDEVGPFREDLHYHFDTEFGIRLLFAGYRPLIVERRLGAYTRHAGSKSTRSPEAFGAEAARFKSLFWGRLTWPEKRRALVREGEYRLRDSIRAGHPWRETGMWLQTLLLAPVLGARLLARALVRGSAA